MKTKPIVIHSAFLLAGIAIGLMIPRKASIADLAPGGEQVVQSLPEDKVARTPGPSADAPLPAKVRHRPPQAPAKPSGAVADERTDVVVPRNLLMQLGAAAGHRGMEEELFSENDPIQIGMDINPAQKAALESAWENAKQRLWDFQKNSRRMEAIDDWTVRITVPDMSSNIDSISKGLEHDASRILGKDRAEAFLAAKQVDKTLSQAGGERVYMVTSQETGDGDWTLSTQMRGPNGAHIWFGESTPEHLNHLLGDLKVDP